MERAEGPIDLAWRERIPAVAASGQGRAWQPAPDRAVRGSRPGWRCAEQQGKSLATSPMDRIVPDNSCDLSYRSPPDSSTPLCRKRFAPCPPAESAVGDTAVQRPSLYRLSHPGGPMLMVAVVTDGRQRHARTSLSSRSNALQEKGSGLFFAPLLFLHFHLTPGLVECNEREPGTFIDASGREGSMQRAIRTVAIFWGLCVGLPGRDGGQGGGHPVDGQLQPTASRSSRGHIGGKDLDGPESWRQPGGDLIR